MRRSQILCHFLISIFLASIAFSQERRALSVEDVEDLLKSGVSQRRVAELVQERGVNFEATGEIRERLKRAGAEEALILVLGKASLEFVKRRVEEEKRRADEDRKKIEEQKIKLEEEKRKVEEEKSKIEEAKRKEEERKKTEEEARRRAESAPKVITGRDGAEMVLVPAGEFWMGSSGAEVERVVEECEKRIKITKEAVDCRDFYRGEQPRHRVVLDEFYIDKYEVSNALFERFVGATG
ncbi:MAG: SUMF1/EgtB/PvdO family nonheme iron enzyme, partial [Deltaproteobacteria bacterium]|nr:SUMF1/EgtB/PvdO family nonheme iron enzyme [Deltaproteobacteria bacterium]